MKTTGWIFTIIGVLAFFGASLKGHSVFGPCFFLALGLFLINKASSKDQDKTKNDQDKKQVD